MGARLRVFLTREQDKTLLNLRTADVPQKVRDFQLKKCSIVLMAGEHPSREQGEVKAFSLVKLDNLFFGVPLKTEQR